MQSRLTGFIELLRSHDVRVSPAETLDAMAVAGVLGYSDRTRLRDGLALTLAKTVQEEALLERCFEAYFHGDRNAFSAAGEGPDDATPDAGETAPAGTASDDAQVMAASTEAMLTAAGEEVTALGEALDTPLLQQLVAGDRAGLSLSLAKAGTEAGLGNIRQFTQKGLYTRRILEALGEEVLRRAISALEESDHPAQHVLRNYRDLLREQVRQHVEREYLLKAEGQNRQFMDNLLSNTRLNHVEHRYQQQVQELVRKMARKLAARYARKPRNQRRGRLDMARTLRRGIPHEGIMFHTYWRRQRREKAQVLALCDVSGSVAAYAKFLLMFLYSLQDVLPKIRSFAFSSHLGEVTDLFDEYPLEKAVELVNWRYGGATDYGTALTDFSKLALDDINRNTTVIILGDARNNRGDPKLEVMQSIYQRSRQVIWLNPESRRAWGTGDSEMPRYLSACHFSAECNTLAQLERVVDQLLRLTN